MKHSLLLAILFFSTISGSFAQSRSELQKQKDLKEKQDQANLLHRSNGTSQNKNGSTVGAQLIDGNKPVILSGSKEYNLIKAEGRIAHYEVKQREGKVTSVEKTIYTAKSPLASTLTPCDIVPPGTMNPLGAPIDDETYYDYHGTYIQLPFSFCFYGTQYTEVNYSTNGNIQFPPTNNAGFSSVGFPAPNDRMIAPFWSDCDNRGSGSYLIDVFPTYAVFTWQNMGYYNSHSNLINDFQMVITDGADPILPPGKNVGFYYNQMQWTTGDASSGVGGFPNPAITPKIPATVGANAGNGIDYFLIGRFGQPGAFYDGPLGADDGVSWLDGKRFFLNACPPIGANQEPLNLTGGYCDTMKVCGNDTLYKKYTFSGPEVSQTVSITASAPTLGSAFSFSVLPNTNSTDIFMIIDGSIATGGYHTVTMTATDNGTPVLSSVQQFVVYVNQAALNNLNGTIVLNPILGACPGGTVTASVNVSGGVPDGYLWSNNETTASTSYTTVVPADSLIFVTLTSGQCQKSIIGNIDINPVPVVSITGNTSFCSGNASSTVLTATNTLNPSTQGPHTYNWAGTGTIGSANSPSTTLTQGTYTVTITNQFGCTGTGVTTVILNESPSYSLTSLNAISGGSVYCVNQDTARIGINFSNSSSGVCGLATTPCISSNTFQVGTGTNTGSGANYLPYEGLWESAIHQYLIRGTELTAAGVQPGKLSSVAFNITSLNAGQIVYENFNIKMKCTADAVLDNTIDQVGLIDVFPSTTINATTGWNTYNFTQPYVWDGTSNILVSVCFWNPDWDGNNIVQYTNAGFPSSRGADQDGSSICGVLAADGVGNNRPNMRFGNCLAQQVGTQFNVVVTPSVGVTIPAAHDSIMFDLPSTSGITCYTISLVNPLGGCSKDTVICVNAQQGITQATLTASSATICPTETITLSPLGTLTSYTISYTDGTGAHISDNAPVTFTPSSVPGTFVYTLSATGPCGGQLTPFTTTVVVSAGTTEGALTASQTTSICPGSSIDLSVIQNPLNPLATYTIQYNTGSGVQSSVNSSVTIVPTNTINPVFGVHTYTLLAQGPCSAPIIPTTLSVTVVPGVTEATLTATQMIDICPGSSIDLSVIQNPLNPLATYTIQYNTGSGVQSTINSSVTIVPTNTVNPVFGVHTYTLIAQGPCNALPAPTTISVTVSPGLTPSITLVPTPSVICIGSQVTLSVTGTAFSTYTISYVDGTGPHTSSGMPTFTPNTAGINTYSVTADGLCNSPQSFTTTVVNVAALASLTIAPMPNVTKCLSGSTVLTANVTSNVAGTTYTYVWTANGALAPGANTNQSYTSNATTTTTYVVGVTGSCASPVASSVIVTNFADNINVSIIDSASACANTEFQLTTSTSGGVPDYSYDWTLVPNIGSIGSGSSLAGTAPGTEGTYTIAVVVTDSCGYTDFDMQLITVLPPCDIVIPNIITPNGDGANDVFKIKNLEYHPNTVLTIFDRWGRKVYDTPNYGNDWKGEGINDGTFFYILDVPDDKKYSGYLTIFTGN